MAEFLAVQPYILQYEGGYNLIKGDKGGETYQGISRNNFPNWEGWVVIDGHKPLGYNEIIQDYNLLALVNQFYKANFWDKMLGDGIDSQEVATYLYDFKVNAGGNAVKCVQRILGIADDGVFGNGSLNALNAYQGDLLKELHEARCAYYNRIGTNGSAKFLQGWLNRANNLYNVLS